jgi:predicted RNase H-like nuclease (RuvC/YqgF family)
MFTVMVEPSKGERGMTERRVGMYACSKCGTKFPTVISKQRYLIVAEEQLKNVQDELASVKRSNEELQGKLQSMSSEQQKLQTSLQQVLKDSDVKQLQTKLATLEDYVGHLRKEKKELEQKASRLR